MAKNRSTSKKGAKKTRREPRALIPVLERSGVRQLRAMRPWKRLPEFARLRQEMDRLFEDVAGRFHWPLGLGRLPALFGREVAEWEPAPVVDVYEENDAVVVKAEMPGMERDDLEVSIGGDVLTLRGEKRREEEVRDGDYYRRERSYGAFSRALRLPVEVQVDKATAQFRNGVLEVRVPKTEGAKRRTISVQVD